MLEDWFNTDYGRRRPEGWDVIVTHLDPEDRWDPDLTGLKHQ